MLALVVLHHCIAHSDGLSLSLRTENRVEEKRDSLV